MREKVCAIEGGKGTFFPSLPFASRRFASLPYPILSYPTLPTTQKNVLGRWYLECPILERAARHDKHNKTVKPKKTTAFSRTHTVCMLLEIRREFERKGLFERSVPCRQKRTKTLGTGRNRNGNRHGRPTDRPARQPASHRGLNQPKRHRKIHNVELTPCTDKGKKYSSPTVNPQCSIVQE